MQTQIDTTQLNKAQDIMSELYDELIPLFGRSDKDLRLINKMLRDILAE